MELTVTEQIFGQLKKANKILIVLPENISADSLSSALALRLFLNKQQKDVVLLSSGKLPDNLNFLPGSEFLKNEISSGKSMVITLNTSVKKLEEISYQTSAESVNIFLKAQDKEFDQSDITFGKEKFPVDLIIILEAGSLESLGKIYERHADLFFETPKINIDNKPGNEYFGAINLIDITATSVAEILAELLQKYEQQLIDEDMATCLLTGIISKTHSFQHVLTTPKAFLKAGELVALGGRQQEIIKHIYKTKSLPLLKLWGRSLARMKTKEQAVYSVLNLVDFEKAEGSAADVLPVLKEFTDNVSGYKIMAVIAENSKDSVSLSLAFHEQVNPVGFLQGFGKEGKIFNFNFGSFKVLQVENIPLTLEAVESKFLEILKSV